MCGCTSWPLSSLLDSCRPRRQRGRATIWPGRTHRRPAMTDALLVITMLCVLAIGGVLAVRDAGRRRWRRSLVTYALRLPRGLAAEDVAAFLTACTGLRARRLQRPFAV